MTHKIYALENTPARLCASISATDSPEVAELIKAYYEAKGYIVNISKWD